jgi:hypothetical protein
MIVVLLTIVWLAAPQAPGDPLPVPEEAVRGFFRELEGRFAARDTDRLLDLYATEFEGDYGATDREAIRDRVNRLFAAYPVTEFRTEVRRLETHPDFAVAGVSSVLRYGPDATRLAVHEDRTLWILVPGPEGLLARERFPVDAATWDGYRDGRYRSGTGGYEIACPPGWVLFVPSMPPTPVVFDVAWLVHPRTDTIAGVAVVDLPPRPVQARELAWLEVLNLQGGRVPEVELTRFQPTRIGDGEAWETRLIDRTSGVAHQVRRISAVRGRLYYTVYLQQADSTDTPPEPETAREEVAAFTRLVEQFRFLEAAPPRAGRVEGDRFLVPDLGCEIQAPPGWRVAPTASRYLFRAVLVPPDPDASSLVQFLGERASSAPASRDPARTRVESVMASLEACVPGTRRIEELHPIRSGEWEGWQAVIEVPAPYLARTRSISAFLREGVLYLFYCDAIPPRRFEELRPVFESIVASLRVP